MNINYIYYTVVIDTEKNQIIPSRYYQYLQFDSYQQINKWKQQLHFLKQMTQQFDSSPTKKQAQEWNKLFKVFADEFQYIRIPFDLVRYYNRMRIIAYEHSFLLQTWDFESRVEHYTGPPGKTEEERFTLALLYRQTFTNGPITDSIIMQFIVPE